MGSVTENLWRLIPGVELGRWQLNGMLFFASSIHDFDLARWLMNDEATEVHAYKPYSIRTELERMEISSQAW